MLSRRTSVGWWGCRTCAAAPAALRVARASIRSSAPSPRLELAQLSSPHRVLLSAGAPPLPAPKEAQLAVSMSQRLRKEHERQQRHRRHQQQQQQMAARGAGGGEEVGELVAAIVHLPAKARDTHALVLPMTGVYVGHRYGLLRTPLGLGEEPASAAAGGAGEGAVVDTQAFSRLWQERGLARRPAVPSEREVLASELLSAWVAPSRRHCAPSTAELDRLVTGVCLPFLRAYWGLRQGDGDGDDGSSAEQGSAAVLAAFHAEARARVAAPLPWSVADAYLQLPRLASSLSQGASPAAAAAGVRAALRDLLAEHAGEWLEVGAADSDRIQLTPAAQRLLLAQLPDADTATAMKEEGGSPAPHHLSPPPPPPPRPTMVAFSPPPAAAVHRSDAEAGAELPCYLDLVAAARAEPGLQGVFNIAQASVRALFQHLLPYVGPAGAGRSLDALAGRCNWGVRYGRVLGSLASFLEAFEDIFFTLHRRLGADGAGAPPGTTGILFVTAYTGPVGPWLLYGRLLCLFYPADRAAPLGLVAESLQWGLHFAPQFGDLPSLLALAGRRVHHAHLLPLRDGESAGDAHRQQEERPGPPSVEEEARWLIALNALATAPAVGGAAPPHAATVSVPFEDAVRAFAEVSCGGKEAAAAAVGAAAETFPYFVVAPPARSESATLTVRRSVEPGIAAMAHSVVVEYVRPLLRSRGAAAVPVARLAGELRLSSAWSVELHPLLRHLRGTGGSGRHVSLAALLWMQTASATGLGGAAHCPWTAAPHRGATTREGPGLSLQVRWVDDAPELLVAFPQQSSPQDCLLAANGLAVHGQPGTAAGASLWPTAPVSLFELVAEADALGIPAAPPMHAETALEAVWQPSPGGGSDGPGDIVVWPQGIGDSPC